MLVFQDNINPFENVTLTSLLLASTIHQTDPSEMINLDYFDDSIAQKLKSLIGQ
jgi:hypothetical protein